MQITGYRLTEIDKATLLGAAVRAGLWTGALVSAGFLPHEIAYRLGLTEKIAQTGLRLPPIGAAPYTFQGLVVGAGCLALARYAGNLRTASTLDSLGVAILADGIFLDLKTNALVARQHAEDIG